MSFRAFALTRSLVRLLAPHCALCGIEPGDPFCAGCHDDFLHDRRARCARCALLLPMHGLAAACVRCSHRPPRFDATIALADYAAPVDALVKAVKFGHRLDLARALGTLLGQRVARAGGTERLRPDVLLPVPLAFERHAERGFNQAAEIARALGAACGIAVATNALLRVRHGPAQESLDLPARRRNVRGAFVVPAHEAHNVRGRIVGVVDDVMTSGSTLDEIAAALKREGARAVVNFVVARTP